MKDSLVAQLIAARAPRESDASPSGNVIVAAVADEEHKSIGTEALLNRYDADGPGARPRPQGLRMN
jgi:Peptidase family M20/M25/M40.